MGPAEEKHCNGGAGHEERNKHVTHRRKAVACPSAWKGGCDVHLLVFVGIGLLLELVAPLDLRVVSALRTLKSCRQGTVWGEVGPGSGEGRSK